MHYRLPVMQLENRYYATIKADLRKYEIRQGGIMAKKKATGKRVTSGKSAASPSISGIPSAGLSKGKVDPAKQHAAKMIERHARISTGMPKNAGMMMDGAWMKGGVWGNLSLDAYNTSYASGNTMYGGGVRDVPTYFVMMNQQNGGVLYWPVSLREKYEWFRYFVRTDAYVGRAIELLCDLPLSKITLNMPTMEDKELREEIHEFYEYQCERLNLFERMHQMLFELNVIGNGWAFHEWDEKDKMWSKIVLLPPEEINSFTYPFSDQARIEYRPEKLLELIKQTIDMPGGTEGDPFMNEIMNRIPKDLVEMVRKEGCIVMDSDPFAGGEVGSFVHQFARRKAPYLDLGASVLERVLIPMLQKENYRYTQLALATRNMTPKNKISAPGLNDPELAELRAQIDLSYMDPDYSVITNYDWTWEQIGAEGRLLDLAGEYEMIENQVFADLGVTRELLTGEGTYSGNRITIEILNTVFLLTRQMLQTYVEQQVFKPVAHANGWFTTNKRGIKKYLYPKLGFNRLTIRDNQEVFESLFQLYQKGSLPIDIIYELFNLDVDSIHDKIKGELFTVKDPNFNRTIENINDEVGRSLVENTDIADRVAKYLGLKPKAPEGEEGGDAQEGGFEQDEGVPAEDTGGDFNFGDNTGSISDAVSEEIPDDASEEDVRAVVEQLADRGVAASNDGG